MKVCGSLSPSMIPTTRCPKVIIAAMLIATASSAFGGTPTSPIMPREASAPSAASIASTRPLVSKAKSKPSAMMARNASVTGPAWGSMTCVAPRSSAIWRRAATGSTSAIVVQPWIFAPITAARPTGPPPTIAIELPAGQAIERITPPAPVWNPQPRGPRISSGASASSTFTTLPARTIAWAAKLDWPKKCEAIDSPLAE